MNRRRFLQASTTAVMATYLPVSPGGYMEDRDMARRLWEVSAELTRDYLGQ